MPVSVVAHMKIEARLVKVTSVACPKSERGDVDQSNHRFREGLMAGNLSSDTN